MSREHLHPMEALVQDFFKGIETKLQAKTGWGRNEVLEVVRDVQVHVLARHLAHTTAQLHPGIFNPPSEEGPPNTVIGRGGGYQPQETLGPREDHPWRR